MDGVPPVWDWIGVPSIWDWMAYPRPGLDGGIFPIEDWIRVPPPPRPGLDGTGAILLRFPAEGLSCLSYVLKRYHTN